MRVPAASVRTTNPRAAFARHFVLEGRRTAARTSDVLESAQHHHREAQLLYLVSGELTCEASGAWWIVPPNSALWGPSDGPHRIRARARLEGYNVYLEPRAARAMPAECC